MKFIRLIVSYKLVTPHIKFRQVIILYKLLTPYITFRKVDKLLLPYTNVRQVYVLDYGSGNF